MRVVERGDDVGGTWYWNRYPGARFDSESYSYSYSFSEELLSEWEWSEHFAAQPETLRYLQHVADRFDLRRDIDFGRDVVAAAYREDKKVWHVEFADGAKLSCRFLISAMGPLSSPTLPTIEGRDNFHGEAYHTYFWPREGLSFKDKRVAVIGTGATAVQMIPNIARDARSLTVFQRNPNWCAPLGNRPISAEEQARLKTEQASILAFCRETYTGFMYNSDRRNALDVSAEERDSLYEKLYNAPGFGIWMGNFRDVLIDEDANKTLSDFVANKIRQRVDDPATAEKLIPTNHGFGTRRVPLETNYFETYNEDHVRLVDIKDTPIERITSTGIQTSEEHFDVDIIVYATGFNAVLGAFDKVEIKGRDALSLKQAWSGGPHTFLGLTVPQFPNLFTILGPHNAGTFCNMPRCIEQNVDWVSDLIAYMNQHDHSTVEASNDAADEWTNHVPRIGRPDVVDEGRLLVHRHQHKSCRATAAPLFALRGRPTDLHT